MKKKFTSQEFLLWAAIGSMVMLFAGFTSAYIVKKNQLAWIYFPLPTIFWISTVVIILSSLFIAKSLDAFKNESFKKYQVYFLIAFGLDILFIYLQIEGFKIMNSQGIKLIGETSNAAASFILVINSVHIIHILGGLVASFIIFIKNIFSTNVNKELGFNRLKLLSIYWHFVGILWIYLFIFYKWIA